MLSKYSRLASLFTDLVEQLGRYGGNAIVQCLKSRYVATRTYSCANTVWKPDSLYANRPYVRLEAFGAPQSVAVTIDILGLLEYTLTGLNSVAGLDLILSRMRKEAYGMDNLEHDIALLESALWFKQFTNTVEFEPRIASSGKPDYRLELGGQEVYTEVKILQLGKEAEILEKAVGERATLLESAGGKIKQRLLEALGVLNEKENEVVDPQVPLDRPSMLLVDLRFAAGLKDDVEALDAFLGQWAESKGNRLSNGVIHNQRAKNVCGMLLIDQFTVLFWKSGIVFIPNPFCRNAGLEETLGSIDVNVV